MIAYYSSLNIHAVLAQREVKVRHISTILQELPEFVHTSECKVSENEGIYSYCGGIQTHDPLYTRQMLY